MEKHISNILVTVFITIFVFVIQTETLAQVGASMINGSIDDYEVLTLPAAYSDWYSLGKGPLTLSMGNPYPKISVSRGVGPETPNDNDSRLNWQHNPNSKVPNIKIGALIAKIGKQGEVFAPFNEKEELNRNRFETSEEIFVAINDYHYSDNQGAFQFVIHDVGQPSASIIETKTAFGTTKALNFFASDSDYKNIRYSWRFRQSVAKYINWGVIFDFFGTWNAKTENTLRAVWSRRINGGAYEPFYTQTGGRTRDISGIEFINGYGWAAKGNWEPGFYKVDVFDEDSLLATGQFEVVSDVNWMNFNGIYQEVKSQQQSKEPVRWFRFYLDGTVMMGIIPKSITPINPELIGRCLEKNSANVNCNNISIYKSHYELKDKNRPLFIFTIDKVRNITTGLFKQNSLDLLYIKVGNGESLTENENLKFLKLKSLDLRP